MEKWKERIWNEVADDSVRAWILWRRDRDRRHQHRLQAEARRRKVKRLVHRMEVK